MTWGDSPESTLHACLYEIECGLFCVTYRSGASASNLHRLPIYQPASSQFVARQRLEQCARALGYHTVVWEGVDAPLPYGLPDPDQKTPFWTTLPAPVSLAARRQERAMAKAPSIDNPAI
jgi:hypothetical protein